MKTNPPYDKHTLGLFTHLDDVTNIPSRTTLTATLAKLLKQKCLSLIAIPLFLLALIPSAQAGDIEGFIIDANTGRYLPGVEIEVVGEGRSATASMEIGLEVFELAAFRVEGYREGRALAL